MTREILEQVKQISADAEHVASPRVALTEIPRLPNPREPFVAKKKLVHTVTSTGQHKIVSSDTLRPIAPSKCDQDSKPKSEAVKDVSVTSLKLLEIIYVPEIRLP